MKLEQEGKVHAVDWKERGGRYEWTAMPHHHHMVCTVCKAVVDLQDEDVAYTDENILKKTGFAVQRHTIELEGICAACR